jgi:hypothetical protein
MQFLILPNSAHLPTCSKTRPVKNKDQVEAMKELWSELVDYHYFYLPGVTTNIS